MIQRHHHLRSAAPSFASLPQSSEETFLPLLLRAAHHVAAQGAIGDRMPAAAGGGLIARRKPSPLAATVELAVAPGHSHCENIVPAAPDGLTTLPLAPSQRPASRSAVALPARNIKRSRSIGPALGRSVVRACSNSPELFSPELFSPESLSRYPDGECDVCSFINSAPKG